jgi:hypothetical protein
MPCACPRSKNGRGTRPPAAPRAALTRAARQCHCPLRSAALPMPPSPLFSQGTEPHGPRGQEVQPRHARRGQLGWASLSRVGNSCRDPPPSLHPSAFLRLSSPNEDEINGVVRSNDQILHTNLPLN